MVSPRGQKSSEVYGHSKAKDSDFQKATERIFRSGKLSSSITIPVQGKIEEKLETWMRLEINGENTRIVDLKNEGASLDFLGYTFRYERDLYGGITSI